MEIRPYITKTSPVNGLPFYHYLHIRGGSGIGLSRSSRLGGEYNFIAYYASPEEMEGCDYCERLWCIDNNIPFGEGDTIEEAFANINKKKP